MVEEPGREVNTLVKEEDGDRWRWYADDAGNRYLSVTTILDCVQPPSLQKWWKTTGPAQIKKRTETATRKGSEVHEQFEHYFKGLDIEPWAVPWIETWEVFANRNHIRVDRSELSVGSHTYGFAGTIDIVGRIDGVPAVFDLKTGRYFSTKTGWQLAAYRLALQETSPGPFAFAGIHIREEAHGIEATLYKVTHELWCIREFLCSFQAWKGVGSHFSKLTKLKWPYLTQYALDGWETGGEKTKGWNP